MQANAQSPARQSACTPIAQSTFSGRRTSRSFRPAKGNSWMGSSHGRDRQKLQSVAAGGSAASAATSTEESAKCWSNDFTGRVLTPIFDKVWGAERPFMFLGMDVGGRGAVIQLSDGSLWTQSPVELTPALKQQLDAIGPVRHIVSPNYEHTKFGRQWKDAYPEATLYGCPGLPTKAPDKQYDAEVGVGNWAPDSWLGEIEVTHLDYETVPVLGRSFFNEVVFLHKPSRSLIVTDLFWSYPSEAPPPTKLWKQGMDRLYAPFYNRFMKGDRGKYQAAMDRIFGWDWDKILPCHGTIITSGGKEALRRHLDDPPQLIRGR
mmetsp:Transcript_9707/g.29242  ORF Transcript_9707/g.29242 Transcript_9707/m.29242 type:complete len:319 (-) Transcript_9707:644-1600(-)